MKQTNIDSDAAFYRSQAEKALAHAEELERFKDWRRMSGGRTNSGLDFRRFHVAKAERGGLPLFDDTKESA